MGGPPTGAKRADRRAVKAMTIAKPLKEFDAKMANGLRGVRAGVCAAPPQHLSAQKPPAPEKPLVAPKPSATPPFSVFRPGRPVYRRGERAFIASDGAAAVGLRFKVGDVRAAVRTVAH
eukprot:4444355-Prymnesium_polylepis.1